MQTRKLLALAMAMGLSTQLYATDTFDMGKVQVLGKDAQTDKIDPSRQKLTFDMGDRTAPMPELVPETGPLEFRPMTEKHLLDNFHRENKDELSIAAGIGTRGANEIIVNGRGTKEGYIGDLTIRREARDGFSSSVDTSKTALEASVSSTGEGSYALTAGGEYSVEEYAQRGLKTIPSPDAGIENHVSRIKLTGNSTLEDGAFFTGHMAVDSVSRDIRNPAVSFSEEQTTFSISAGASYLKKMTDKFKGRAAIDLKKDKFTVTSGTDRDFTKTVLDLGGVYEASAKTTANFGLKRMSLMSRDTTAPYASLDYRFSEPWQLLLAYEEDLGNDSLEKIFMPSRYVAADDINASHLKTAKGSVNYRTNKGDTLGFDVFKQTENDAIEYLDFHNPGKSLLESKLNFVNEARRSGASVRGSFKIEDNFCITLKGTAQTAENNATGRRLSYEPKRLLDVGFNYTEGKVMIDFTRRAEFDREAHTPNATYGADDYSRSDLAVRYKLNDRFSTYLKIKDLYDEAKKIRYDVPEEGRVTLAGLEAHF
ncbi:MAG: TonB-dependent receptor [Candidatus Riflebacteria bacterium]|nr:TonB-dependent receptor [Candidatus Riflebacteria bacterium]